MPWPEGQTMRKQMRRTTARIAGLALAATWLALTQACDDSTQTPGGTLVGPEERTDAACTPACTGTACGDDGCGGTCACDTGVVCNAAHQCVAPTECTDTCEAAGWGCGSLCGTACGPCDDGITCIWNRCYTPPVEVSCDTCSLQLSLLAKEVDSSTGYLTSVSLAVDYLPETNEPHPRLADLRIYANGPVTLTGLVAGPALTDAGKELYNDPITGNPWKARADGSSQLLVLSFTNTNPLASGRVVDLTFAVDTDQQVPFKIIRRDQTFAPPEADAALQSSPYDAAVVVSP